MSPDSCICLVPEYQATYRSKIPRIIIAVVSRGVFSVVHLCGVFVYIQYTL
jgi:hypothetical protein